MKILLIILLLIPEFGYCLIPDTITDPVLRDVLENLDSRVEQNTTFDNSIAPSVVTYPISIAHGGTGQVTAPAALAALGGVGYDGTGATGTWPINISGTVDKAFQLYATPGLCPSGQSPLGVDSYGNPVGCFVSHDNLGNHIATQDLNMSGFNINNVGTINATNVVATTLSGDGSAITNLPIGLWELIDGNLTPRDIIAFDISWELTGDDDIQPL